jgi:Copper binding proteins, plastocyanin/azurin family
MARWALASVLLAALGLAAVASRSSDSVAGRAEASECTVVYHHKRIVRRRVIHRNGHRIVRRRVRIRRWTTCEPVPPAPARLGVSAHDAGNCPGETELCFSLSRPSVAAGPVTIELDNQGEDPHTLRLINATGPGGPFAIPTALDQTVAPGAQRDSTFTLAPGTWHLFCSLPDHEAEGMSANLIVE